MKTELKNKIVGTVLAGLALVLLVACDTTSAITSEYGTLAYTKSGTNTNLSAVVNADAVIKKFTKPRKDLFDVETPTPAANPDKQVADKVVASH